MIFPWPGSSAISLSAALGLMSELITLNRLDEGSQRGHPYVRIGLIRLILCEIEEHFKLW